MATTATIPLRVLIVEDDVLVVRTVQQALVQRGVSCDAVTNLADARRHLHLPVSFDAVVLDLNLPDGSGTDFAQECRQAGSEIPIIMLTARDGVGDRVAGLQHGADDYLCKPFAVEELLARLHAVLRRVRRPASHVLRYADVEVDLVRRQVRRQEAEVSLSARELDLLAFFMCHPDQLLEKDRILREVWGDEAEQDANVLHVYANYLRNKLEQGRFSRLLHTVRGVGYVFSHNEPKG